MGPAWVIKPTCDQNPVMITLYTPVHHHIKYHRELWHYDKDDFWGLKLTDSNLTNKKWWQIVNSLSGRSSQNYIPVIEENNRVCHLCLGEVGNLLKNLC